MKQWEKFTKEELQQIVSESYSYAEIAEKVGYATRGGSGQNSVKEMCSFYAFSTEHFSQKLRADKVNIDGVFIKGYKHRETLRKNLIALRGNKCECCELEEWRGVPIALQVHHKDGDTLNNTLENLVLLCPNCHAQTENYCGKNKERLGLNEEELVEALRTSENIHQALVKIGKTDGRWYPKVREIMKKHNIVFCNEKQESKLCPNCGKPISKKATVCLECSHLKQRISKRPSREELKVLVRNNSFASIGRQYGVSDNAVRKWCQSYQLPSKVGDIKQYSDEEWLNI